MIEVVGNGSISVFPEIFQLVMGVRSQTEVKVEQAQYEVSKKINQFITTLYQKGINEHNITTYSYSIQPIYDYQNGQNQYVGSVVEHLLQVTSTDMNQIGHLLDLGVAQGVNVVNGISFKLKDETSYYQEAIVLAMEDAKQKATRIANHLGVNLKPLPKEVKEEGLGGFETKVYGGSSTTIMPGNIDIRGQVRVRYDYSL